MDCYPSSASAMIQLTETTIDAQTEILTRTLLIGSKRKAFHRRMALLCDSLLWSCLYSAGNQTSGSLFEHPIQMAFHGEGATDCLPEWVDKLTEVSERYFRQLGAVEPEQVLAPEEVRTPIELRPFVERLREIRTVETLRAREIERGYKTWVVVNNASEQTRYAVYRAEWNLMRQFPDVAFDFHLVDREGEDLDSIIAFDDETLSIPVGGARRAF